MPAAGWGLGIRGGVPLGGRWLMRAGYGVGLGMVLAGWSWGEGVLRQLVDQLFPPTSAGRANQMPRRPLRRPELPRVETPAAAVGAASAAPKKKKKEGC